MAVNEAVALVPPRVRTGPRVKRVLVTLRSARMRSCCSAKSSGARFTSRSIAG
jgi:hypothetical protein